MLTLTAKEFHFRNMLVIGMLSLGNGWTLAKPKPRPITFQVRSSLLPSAGLWRA